VQKNLQTNLLTPIQNRQKLSLIRRLWN